MGKLVFGRDTILPITKNSVLVTNTSAKADAN